MRKEVIAQQHAGFIPPTGVDRGEMPPQARLVQNVVVDERGGMDHLHHGSQDQVVWRDRAAGLGREQHQGRPKTLAPQVEAVPGQLIDKRVLAAELAAQDFFDLPQLLNDRIVKVIEQSFGVRDVSQAAHACPRIAAMRVANFASGLHTGRNRNPPLGFNPS